MKPSGPLLDEVSRYYSQKLAEHGTTPRGVDWNGEESQRNRFDQLVRMIDGREPFSINDVGCGYGAFHGYLAGKFPSFSYVGCDVSADMVAAAVRASGTANARYVHGAEPPAPADYSVASGIFNVRLDRPETEWAAYIDETLDLLDRFSRRGFAFNCLTSYSDPGKMRGHLHYADPCALFNRCKQRYARNVALLHDYGLYEFTILVRKHP